MYLYVNLREAFLFPPEQIIGLLKTVGTHHHRDTSITNSAVVSEHENSTPLILLPRSQNSSVGIAMGWKTEKLWFDSQQKQEMSLFSMMFRSALRSTQPPT